MARNIKLKGMCRLCGTSDNQPSSMKNILSDEPEFANMAETIYKYFGITISSEDTFPKEVCECCLLKIKSFDEYVDQCVNVQKFFVKLSHGDPDTSTFGDKFDIIKSEPLQVSALEILPDQDVKDESNVLVKIEIDDVDDEMSNSVFDDGMDYPISDLLPKKKKKLKEPKKKKSTSKKHKHKLKNTAEGDIEETKPNKTKLYIKPDGNLKNYFSFRCYICEEQMHNWYKLKSHMLQIHKEQPKVECTCGYVVKSKTAIYRHVQGHTDPACFSCDKCSRITKSQTALDKHKMSHIPKPERVYPCASCPRIFNSKENLRSHERVHLPLFERYNYPCTICGNKFTTKSAVVGHTRAVHEKIKRYICDVCGYACSTGGELIQHRAIHSEEKLFQCTKCPKKFKTGSNLKAHLDTHADTSYPCDMCDKVLNSRRTYRKHLLVHDDLCRHVCTFCNKAFKRRQTLKVHLTCHTGDTPVQCPWCPQKFAYSSACRTHKQRCHPEEFMLQQQQQNNTQPRHPNAPPNTNVTQPNSISTPVTIHYESMTIEPSDTSKEVLKLTLEIPTDNGTERLVTEIPQCDNGS